MMIFLIFKSYMSILLSIGIGSLFIFILGLYFIFKFPSTAATQDLSAIAGDDMMATQLDLARAYIEAGKQSLATPMLELVMSQGSASERQEAKRLLRFASSS